MATTQPGGVYRVGDLMVDANGLPVDKSDTIEMKVGKIREMEREIAELRAQGAQASAQQRAAGEGGAGTFDVEGASKADLQAEAERRGLVVARTDGKDGEPRAEDFRAALGG
jgi:hypothetical protein